MEIDEQGAAPLPPKENGVVPAAIRAGTGRLPQSSAASSKVNNTAQAPGLSAAAAAPSSFEDWMQASKRQAEQPVALPAAPLAAEAAAEQKPAEAAGKSPVQDVSNNQASPATPQAEVQEAEKVPEASSPATSCTAAPTAQQEESIDGVPRALSPAPGPAIIGDSQQQTGKAVSTYNRASEQGATTAAVPTQEQKAAATEELPKGRGKSPSPSSSTDSDTSSSSRSSSSSSSSSSDSDSSSSSSSDEESRDNGTRSSMRRRGSLSNSADSGKRPREEAPETRAGGSSPKRLKSGGLSRRESFDEGEIIGELAPRDGSWRRDRHEHGRSRSYERRERSHACDDEQRRLDHCSSGRLGGRRGVLDSNYEYDLRRPSDRALLARRQGEGYHQGRRESSRHHNERFTRSRSRFTRSRSRCGHRSRSRSRSPRVTHRDRSPSRCKDDRDGGRLSSRHCSRGLEDRRGRGRSSERPRGGSSEPRRSAAPRSRSRSPGKLLPSKGDGVRVLARSQWRESQAAGKEAQAGAALSTQPLPANDATPAVGAAALQPQVYMIHLSYNYTISLKGNDALYCEAL